MFFGCFEYLEIKINYLLEFQEYDPVVSLEIRNISWFCKDSHFGYFHGSTLPVFWVMHLVSNNICLLYKMKRYAV